MKKISLFSIMILFGMKGVYGQATRTWVSGVGDDVNPCSRTAPCKTFAGAISKTAAGGEINALDPGGYGAVTITKSITINGGGTMAGILLSSTFGITVNGGSDDIVVLKNIYFQGSGNGTNGIRFLAGKELHLKNVDIENLANGAAGIEVSGANQNKFVNLENTRINVGDTSNANSAGIRANVTNGSLRISITDSQILSATNGISADSAAIIDIKNSKISKCKTGLLLKGLSKTSLQTTSITQNLIGIDMIHSNTEISIQNCHISNNSVSGIDNNPGKTFSFGGNMIYNNGTDGPLIIKNPR